MAGTYLAIALGADMKPSNGTILAEGPTEADVLPYWKPGRVVIGWRPDEKPPRRLSQESLASVRRKRLRRRLERKHPLLADELYQRELDARPDFYAGHRVQ